MKRCVAMISAALVILAGCATTGGDSEGDADTDRRGADSEQGERQDAGKDEQRGADEGPNAGVSTPVEVAEHFLDALADADFDRALEVSVPGSFTLAGLGEVEQTLRLGKAEIDGAWAGERFACITTNPIPSKRENTGDVRLGLALVKQDGAWLVTDGNYLVTEKTLQDYLAEFRKAEPNAQVLVGQEQP